MFKDLKIVGYMSIALIAALVIGFSFPALTDPGAADPRDVQIQQAMSAERKRCQSSLDGVDCACYAQKAGYVKAQAQPKPGSGRYIDPDDLARAQAASGCRK